MYRIVSHPAASRLRGWAVGGFLALAGALAPQAVVASSGCVLLDGQSGQLGPGQSITLNPTRGINFNPGDVLTLTSSSPNARGDVISLDVAVLAITKLLDPLPTAQSAVISRGVVGGPQTIFIRTTALTPGLVANYAIRCQSVGPTVAQVSPSTGIAGSTVSIDGTGFLGTSGVSFGGQPATGFSVASDTRITATAPAGTGSVPVTVTTDAGSARGGQFTYASVPDAPLIGAVSVGNGQAVVTFSPPVNEGGQPITQYTVTSHPGGVSVSGAASPLTVGGLVNGTPYTFTVVATNAVGTSASSAPSSVVVPMALPTAADRSLVTDYGKAIGIDLGSATNGVGVTGVAIDTPPAHGTATLSGTVVTYVPAIGFHGDTDSFTYTVANAVGRSSPGRVSIAVGSPDIPTPSSLTVVTTTGVPVTILPPPGSNDSQAGDRLDVGTSPAHGQVVANGRTLVYTPAAGFVGIDTFTYRSATSFGVSAPATVTIDVTREGGTGALSRTVTALPGDTVTVDLSSLRSDIASASLSGLSPGQAGEASVSAGGLLRFTSQPTFHGLAQVSATLTTSGGDIVPVSVLVLVSSEPDPSKNADVVGLVTAQVEQAQRFAQGQLDNIQGRLDSLHDRLHDAPMVSNRLALNVNGRAVPLSARPGIGAAEGGGDTSPSSSATPDDHGVRIWMGGQANFGSFGARRAASGFDSETVTVSTGADVRVGDRGLFGMALGYSHDRSDVGNHGARSTAQGYSAALYGSLQPGERSYLDVVVGGGGLRFDSRRTDADSDRRLTGRRTGQQWFGSITGGYAYRTGAWTWSPYGRASWSMSSLNDFAEDGPVTGALAYGRQIVRSSMLAIGLRVGGENAFDAGTLAPHARIEVGHDFQGSGSTTLAYAQIPSAGEWSVSTNTYSETGTRVQIGLGLDLRLRGEWSLGGEYGYLWQPRMRDQTIRFTVNKSL